MQSGDSTNVARKALYSYVLITPARNEAAFIELTLKSVAAQTTKPLRWLIVSDGSTDETDDIVRKYTAQHAWIELLRIPERQERNFAGKVQAFNAGYEVIRSLDFYAIGSLDADISFDQHYFAFLLDKLAEDPHLGLVGTPFEEAGEMYNYRFVSIEHVSGACQLFRRRCFEDIGGYIPVKGGGIDHIAVLMARMKGWQTRTFTQKVSQHHRAQGSAVRSPLLAKFHVGGLDYKLGSHPLWEVCRSLYQTTKRPFIISGLMIFLGYAWSMALRVERAVSPELMTFRRREQILRLKELLVRTIPFCNSVLKRSSNGPALARRPAQ